MLNLFSDPHSVTPLLQYGEGTYDFNGGGYNNQPPTDWATSPPENNTAPINWSQYPQFYTQSPQSIGNTPSTNNSYNPYGYLGTQDGVQAQATGNAVGSGATGLIGIGEYFLNQRNINKQFANTPKYQIPPEVQQGLNLANQQAAQGLPEAMKQQYLSNLQRSTAYSLSQNNSRAGGLATIGTLNAQNQAGDANLLAQDQAAQYQRQQNVYGQLENVADQKAQQWQINTYNPQMQKNQAINANNGALFQNLAKTGQGLAQSAALLA